jgi:citrate lyase subunit beta/citryl-CoA lyase
MTTPVRRSELVCPGHSMKMMSKAAASDADEVIFDLEDACPPSQKEAARQTVAEALQSLQFSGGKVRAVRINAVGTPWWKDDIAVAAPLADVVVVPKARSSDDVRAVAELTGDKVRLEVLIESAAALIHAYEIACVPRVASLIFGVADYAADTGARDFRKDHDRLFYYPRAHLLACARAASVQAIDSVTVQYQDKKQLEKDSRAAAQLGFDGKWAIHPAQLSVIHEAFNPTSKELAEAQKIVAAYDKAGQGAIELDGEMVDAATVKVAQRKLDIARRARLL